MTPDEIINAFFNQDGQTTQTGLKRKSILLALKNDLEFCILLPKIWINDNQSKVKLSSEQYAALQQILPSFTVISLFCTAIDVLARVDRRNAIPSNGETNSEYFKTCAIKWFKLTNKEAEELWLLRNGISHGYKLASGRHATRQYGHGHVMKQRDVDGVWEFYLHAMYSSFIKAKQEIYENLLNLEPQGKDKTAEYLENNGFFYTMA